MTCFTRDNERNNPYYADDYDDENCEQDPDEWYDLQRDWEDK